MRKIVSIFIITIIIFTLTGCGNQANLNKTVTYLEEQGYSCEKGNYHVGTSWEGDYRSYEDATMCSKQDDLYNKQIVIRTKKDFSIEITAIDKDNYKFTINEYSFRKHSSLAIYKGNEFVGHFSGREGFINNGLELPGVCDIDPELPEKTRIYKIEKCAIFKDHLKIVNESIKEYMNIYKAIDIELPKK